MSKRIPTRRGPSQGVVRRASRSGANMNPKPVTIRPTISPPNFK